MAELTQIEDWEGEADAEPKSSSSCLSVIAVEAVLGALCLSKIEPPRDGPAALSVLRLPDDDWLEPAKRALRNVPGLNVEVLRQSRRGAFTFDLVDILDGVARGQSTILVLHGNPPAALTNIADAVIDVPRHIEPKLVASVIKTVSGIDVAYDLIPAGGVSLTTLLAAVRPGRTVSDCTARLHALEKANLEVDRPEVPYVQDLVGYGAEATEWASSAVIDLSRVMSGLPSSGIQSALFYGPPGTGKTTIANAIAKTAGVPLVSTSIGNLFSRGEGSLGDVIAAFDEFLAEAKAKAPCVAFIDECDALPSRVGMTSRGREWWSSLIARALIGVEELRRANPPILLLGATNDLGALDPALIRSGRFDKKIQIPVPTTEDLARILDKLTGETFPMESLIRVASFKPGGTGADARTWVDAATRAATLNGRDLCIEDLLAQVRPADNRSVSEKRTVAIHEAGHITVALALGVPVIRASISSFGIVGGDVDVHVDPVLTADAVSKHLRIALGGRAADMIYGAGPNAGAASDLAKATSIAVNARVNWGLADRLLHIGNQSIEAVLASDAALSEHIEADLAAALEGAKAIVRERASTVFAIVDALLEQEVLDQKAIDALGAKPTISGRIERLAADLEHSGQHFPN